VLDDLAAHHREKPAAETGPGEFIANPHRTSGLLVRTGQFPGSAEIRIALDRIA
jgi:hypothetical protein